MDEGSFEVEKSLYGPFYAAEEMALRQGVLTGEQLVAIQPYLDSGDPDAVERQLLPLVCRWEAWLRCEGGVQ